MNASMSDGAILMALSTRMCRKSPSAQSRYTIFVDTWRYAAASLTVSNVRNQSAESSANGAKACDCVDSEAPSSRVVARGCKALLLPWAGLIRPSKPWVGGSSPSRRARKRMKRKREATLANLEAFNDVRKLSATDKPPLGGDKLLSKKRVRSNKFYAPANKIRASPETNRRGSSTCRVLHRLRANGVCSQDGYSITHPPESQPMHAGPRMGSVIGWPISGQLCSRSASPR